MQKALRVILGTAIVGLVLNAAYLATRDCTVGLYVYDNCMWVRIRTYLGLPASRFLRIVVLESVGIALALILYLTFRYVFAFRWAKPAPQDSTETGAP
jgi:hypothetical protein